jgi:hypothetical protein
MDMNERLHAKTYALLGHEIPTYICLFRRYFEYVSVTLRPSVPREKSLGLGGWVHIRAAENMWIDAGMY